MSKPLLEQRIGEWKDKLNKSYEGKIVDRVEHFGALKLLRFCSGVLKLDLALGGGWPFGRVAVVAGEYSTGKTLIALKAAQEVEKYCHNCHRFGGMNVGGIMQMSQCKCGDFTPGAALFVDLEGSFDRDWAVANGFNEKYHLVGRPETAEQAIDLVDAAVRDNIFDLIIIDSIAAMTPSKEIETSVEEWQMGLAARLVNKAMRKWNASLNKMSQTTKAGGPLILCLNQIRMKIGVVMGDPRTLPGGRGQEFNASIIIYTKSAEISDDAASKESAWGTYKGVTKKNKTYVPKMEYEFDMALKDISEGGSVIVKKGIVNNAEQLIKEGKRLGLVKSIGDGIGYDMTVVKTEKALLSQIQHKPEVARKLWRHILKVHTDQDTV